MSTSSPPRQAADASLAGEADPRVIWHELECGSYRADLALWRELADHQGGTVLEVGAGSGRVALELSRSGHRVTALDSDPLLLTALRGRHGGEAVRTVCADARSFDLSPQQFELCLVPMQTIQLFGGAAGRIRFLSRARTALCPGGLLACAILGDVAPFDCTAGELGPPADTALIDGLLYRSRATRVALTPRKVLIERQRHIRRIDGAATDAAAATGGNLPGAGAGAGGAACERDVVELDRLSPGVLRREAQRVGLRAERPVELPPTEDHVGSTVVMLRG